MNIVYVWIGISSIGLLLSLHLSLQSHRDLGSLGDRANGRRKIAFSRFLREFLRATVHIMWIVSGLSALDVIGNEWFVPGLLWGNICLVVNSLIDARTRPILFQSREHHEETPIEQQDREVGDERRRLQQEQDGT